VSEFLSQKPQGRLIKTKTISLHRRLDSNFAILEFRFPQQRIAEIAFLIASIPTSKALRKKEEKM